MKKINHLLTLLSLGSMLVFASCTKDEEPTPDNNPTAPVLTSVMTANNKGTSGTAVATLKVDNSTGSAKLRLDVTYNGDLDRIYIMKSEDNGSLVGQNFTTITNAEGQTFTSGSADYSFKVPSSTKNFILDVPVSVRTSTSAVTDVYYVWITNGIGDFTKPTKNTVLGPAVLTLQYGASTTASFSTGNATLGDQTAIPGSLLVTSGKIGAFLTADYNDAPESADLALVALDNTGTTKTNGSVNIYLVSPDTRTSLGFLNEPAAANTTYISAYAGSFEDANGATLQGLNVGTGTKVKLTQGSVYQFYTEKGKKGLIKVNTLTTGPGTAEVSVKVLN